MDVSHFKRSLFILIKIISMQIQRNHRQMFHNHPFLSILIKPIPKKPHIQITISKPLKLAQLRKHIFSIQFYPTSLIIVNSILFQVKFPMPFLLIINKIIFQHNQFKPSFKTLFNRCTNKFENLRMCELNVGSTTLREE